VPHELKVLFTTSEVHPLVKTGGLADVAQGLSQALHELGVDVRLCLPAYRTVLDQLAAPHQLAQFHIAGCRFPVRLLLSRLPATDVPLYLVDIPQYYDRVGGPYGTAEGLDWPDNAQRFAAFSRVCADLALGRLDPHWQPDLVHANDWQTALVPALLSLEPRHPASVFTIHNLAYQGRFPADTFQRLALPQSLWGPEGLEFYGDLVFIKGGLLFADWLTTVSPTYAQEIQTPPFGYGLDPILRWRSERLVGILNGVDYHQWDPRRDPYIPAHYDPDHLDGKARDKDALRAHFGILGDPDAPLAAFIGRLVEQKGADLILDALPQLLARGLRLVILGSGDADLEARVRRTADAHPGQVAAHLGYSEALAHLIEAGADLFLMPSRFEPCGLNQIYSLRYGTVPVVHRTGGLADSVVDASPENLAQGTATGFQFAPATAGALAGAVHRALDLYADRPRWEALMRRGMAQDFSWQRAAGHYLALYRRALGG